MSADNKSSLVLKTREELDNSTQPKVTSMSSSKLIIYLITLHLMRHITPLVRHLSTQKAVSIRAFLIPPRLIYLASTLNNFITEQSPRTHHRRLNLGHFTHHIPKKRTCLKTTIVLVRHQNTWNQQSSTN